MDEVQEIVFDENGADYSAPTSSNFDYSNYVDVTLTEKHWYDNPKYNDGLHYTTKNALSQPFEFCLTNGGRSNGKTTGWLFQMVDDFFNYGMVYGKIVRKYTFSQELSLSWFDELVRNYIKEVWQHEIIVIKFNYYVVPLECRPDRYLPLEKGQRKPRLNAKLLCEVFNLALENDRKSHDFKYIKRLIFEEYTLINNADYLPEEVEHFNSLISTINRDREDLSVVFIGNTISKHNPYFDWLGINVNKMKLKAGEWRRIQCNAYENGARIFIEVIPSVYGDEIKCPRILKVGNNEIAVTGEWTVSENIIYQQDDEFINNITDKKFNVAIRTDNKLYYHFTCNYKNNIFNVITNRIKNIKSDGLIFEYDVSTIERIKNGTISKKKFIERIEDCKGYDTVFSDDEIEYKYNKLLRGK